MRVCDDYQLAVLRGVSIYVAVADEGADTTEQFFPAATAGLNVSGFAITAYDVAVGGTDFADTFLNQTCHILECYERAVL